MAKKPEGWTPYGLEAIRVAHLRRRRYRALALALGLMVLWSFMFTETTETQLELSTDSGSSRIEVDVSDALRKEEDGPLTIGINPGRVTRADTGSAVQEAAAAAFAAPTFERAPPIGWSYYVLIYGPYLLVGLALYMLSRRPPKHELNYGIYKGSMPYEMITAHASKHVFSTREARTSIFGRRRGDHLPPEALAIERVPQEEEA